MSKRLRDENVYCVVWNEFFRVLMVWLLNVRDLNLNKSTNFK